MNPSHEYDGDFVDGNMFGIADAPWLPTYLDIVSNPSEYYQRFGFMQLEVPTDCPLTSALMPWMNTLFEGRFAFRYINRETLEQWQTSLQYNMDSRVHTLEHSLELYARHKDAMMEVFKHDTTTRTIDRAGTRKLDGTTGNTLTSTATGSVEGDSTATDRNTSSFHDTPDSAVNVQDVYNNGMTRAENYGTTASTSSTRDTRSDEATGTSQSNENTTDKITESIDNITMDDPNKQVEDACRIWRDLASEFVAGFEKNFMSILWC